MKSNLLLSLIALASLTTACTASTLTPAQQKAEEVCSPQYDLDAHSCETHSQNAAASEENCRTMVETSVAATNAGACQAEMDAYLACSAELEGKAWQCSNASLSLVDMASASLCNLSAAKLSLCATIWLGSK